MLKLITLILSLVIPLSSFARMNKLEVLNLIKTTNNKKIPLDTGFLERDIEYDKRKLSIQKRVESEMKLMISQMTLKIQEYYKQSIDLTKDERMAEKMVKEKILEDLELADVHIRDELTIIAYRALSDIVKNQLSYQASERVDDLESIKKYFNQAYTRNIFSHNPGATDGIENGSGPLIRPNSKVTAPVYSYKSKNDLLDLLVSDFKSAPWMSTGYINLNSDVLRSRSQSLSIQLSVDFLGVRISAGPKINFRAQLESEVSITAEGFHPVLAAEPTDDGVYTEGNFDFHERNRDGTIKKIKGIPVRRYIVFNCIVSKKFSTNYEGSGGFSVLGIGGDVSWSQSFSNSVFLTSRRTDVPEYIEGKTVTLRVLRDLCHNDFSRTKVSDNLTVEQTLDMNMESVLKTLTFSHPNTKCVVDSQCFDWFNTRVIPALRSSTFPRCIQENTREKYMSCQLRNLKGQTCTLYDKEGKLISAGRTCDKGLRCVQTKKAGWFQNYKLYQNAEAKCLPVDKNSYQDPRTNLRYYEVELMD